MSTPSLVGGEHATAAGGVATYDADIVATQRAQTEARACAVRADPRLSKHTFDLDVQVFEPLFENDPEKARAMRTTVDQLRTRLERGDSAAYVEHPEARAYCSSLVNLRRYAFDSHFDADKAFKKLNETLEWRARMRPWDIDATKLGPSLRLGGAMLTGTDAWGRPVMVVDLPRAPGLTNDQILDLLYAHFEHLRVRLARAAGVQRWVLVCNLEKQTFWNSPSFSVVAEVSKLLVNTFPEFAGTTIIWQPPMAFKAFWAMLSPFLDEITLKKLAIVSGDASPGSEVDAQMRALLGDEWRALTDVDHIHGKTRFNPDEYVPSFERASEIVRAAALEDPNAEYPYLPYTQR